VRLGWFLAVALATAILPGIAAAQDRARGAELARERCIVCHGENGRSAIPDIPSLAGQQAGFMTVQLILMREGIRQVPAMRPFAEGLPDQDIEDMAAWFASLPPGPAEDRGPRDAALASAGEALMAPRHCTSCHLPSLAGRAQIPRVNAQREEFLARTLAEYRDGRRIGADAQMNDAMIGLSDAQIAGIAHYLAHRE
jgi:cytochrome c553